MGLLAPDWSQQRPTFEEAQSMCRRVSLNEVQLESAVFRDVLSRLRESHSNGGAVMASFELGADRDFDWFASRNRLNEENILPSLLSRHEVVRSLPELYVPPDYSGGNSKRGFQMESPFLVDGRLSVSLYAGGAYWQSRGDGSSEKRLALGVCEAMFEFRYSEIFYYICWDAWSPWFQDIAWDSTHVVFDRRSRKLWVWATTDTD